MLVKASRCTMMQPSSIVLPTMLVENCPARLVVVTMVQSIQGLPIAAVPASQVPYKRDSHSDPSRKKNIETGGARGGGAARRAARGPGRGGGGGGGRPGD